VKTLFKILATKKYLFSNFDKKIIDKKTSDTPDFFVCLLERKILRIFLIKRHFYYSAHFYSILLAIYLNLSLALSFSERNDVSPMNPVSFEVSEVRSKIQLVGKYGTMMVET